MFIDNELVLADDSTCSGKGQPITSAGTTAGQVYGSAKILDTKGGGNEHSRLWVNIRCGSSFTGTEGATCNVKLKGTNDPTGDWEEYMQTGDIDLVGTQGKMVTGSLNSSSFANIPAGELTLIQGGVATPYDIPAISADASAAISAAATAFNSVGSAAGSGGFACVESGGKLVFTNTAYGTKTNPSTIEMGGYVASGSDITSIFGTTSSTEGTLGFVSGVEYRERVPLTDYRYHKAEFVTSGTITGGGIMVAIVDEVQTSLNNRQKND